MIEIHKLHKDFGALKVLKGVDLSIKEGEVVSILGGSGSGKSTMMRCINGLEEITSGKIIVDNFDVSNKNDLQEVRKRCSTVFQQFDLYPHLSVLDNITLAPISVLAKSKEEANNKAMELLKSVALEDKESVYPAQLSGGQKQRIGICRALAMSPNYLLLDEVTSSLDPEMTAEVLEILKVLASQGITMISVTHEIEFAREISDRIVFLDDGKILKDLPKDEFFSDVGGKSDPRIAKFLSKMGNQ
ncbi:MAG: amino acid ABC transporter ATP-binding protein [Kordiimonadaceae bacterium]|jgi:ABC-type polar amino acid transport system ATPase subunit|nr:amino acid ABC transporter ATP-binding protein [Kordiimonadaceae bacterium]MBT6033512.1 amino acid ABC transporter ATP-binding protein [Kordiimonadaceae bacterium]